MIKNSQCLDSRQISQAGGIVILVCLMLMTLLSVTAFTLSRNVIRETSVTGNVFQSGRSEAASNAGIDWFLAWIGEAMQPGGSTVKNIPDQAKSVRAEVENFSNNPQIGVIQQSWKATITMGNEMVLSGSQNKMPTQAFDLELAFLGKDSSEYLDGKNTASGGAGANAFPQQTYGWELASTGQSIVGLSKDEFWKFQTKHASKLDIRFSR